jgi:ubiquinone/menaquinone biosynthesis C-methylase UbiE
MNSQVLQSIAAAPAEPSRVASLFDSLSLTYDHADNFTFYSALARRMAESVYRHANFGPDSRCLDLACGTGISTEAAVEIFPCAEWHGADQSGEMLRVAEAKPYLGRVAFEQSGADTLPYEPGTFDWVLCNVAYHWLPNTTAQEIHRVLSPGGTLSMMVPLVVPAGAGEGNRWLARVLSKFSRYITPRRSQGMAMPQLLEELGDFTVQKSKLITVEESFPCAKTLIETLVTRSSISAIFGPHADEVVAALAQDQGPVPQDLRFDWNFAHIEARR